MAGNLIEKSNKESIETIIVKNDDGTLKYKTTITYNTINGMRRACTIATHIYLYDTCGTLIGAVKDSYEAFDSACNAAGDGGLLMNIERWNTGFGNCPASY